jgi:hypothetical protein
VLPIGPHARQVQPIRRQGKSDLLGLSPETEQWLRHGYQTRMSTEAVRRDLGEMLAHGEPENGIGQGEVADQAAQPAGEPAPEPAFRQSVEPAGIEPATSCVQSRSSCPLVSRGVSKSPAKRMVLLDTGGHDRTARDNLMHPWCTLSVACVWAAGSRAAVEGAPGCVSWWSWPRRPGPLSPRQSPSARRAAACPRTRPSRARRC